MPSSLTHSAVSSVGLDKCLRMTSEILSSVQFLSSIALTVCFLSTFLRTTHIFQCADRLFYAQSFGAFMLYEWKQGDDTQTHAVPGYIYLVLMLGSMASVANAMSYMGACARSICLLTVSLGMLLFVLLLEAALALTLIYNPSLVDTEVCLPDDAACIARLNSIFKDPSAHAGLPAHLSVLRAGRFSTLIFPSCTR
jgi:hypothetical protein